MASADYWSRQRANTILKHSEGLDLEIATAWGCNCELVAAPKLLPMLCVSYPSILVFLVCTSASSSDTRSLRPCSVEAACRAASAASDRLLCRSDTSASAYSNAGMAAASHPHVAQQQMSLPLLMITYELLVVQAPEAILG